MYCPSCHEYNPEIEERDGTAECLSCEDTFPVWRLYTAGCDRDGCAVSDAHIHLSDLRNHLAQIAEQRGDDPVVKRGDGGALAFVGGIRPDDEQVVIE